MSSEVGLELAFSDWPIEDRRRWDEAFKAGDRFDESDPGAHLAAATPIDASVSVGRFWRLVLQAHRQ
jgi:hypothetical protein